MGAGAIAQKIRAPQNYLSKLLQAQASRGILTSQRGLHGGFQFKKSPKKITLYDIVEPIDNVTIWSGCALGLKKCSDVHPCAVHDKWKQVKSVYMDFLRNTTIQDLV